MLSRSTAVAAGHTFVAGNVAVRLTWSHPMDQGVNPALGSFLVLLNGAPMPLLAWGWVDSTHSTLQSQPGQPAPVTLTVEQTAIDPLCRCIHGYPVSPWGPLDASGPPPPGSPPAPWPVPIGP